MAQTMSERIKLTPEQKEAVILKAKHLQGLRKLREKYEKLNQNITKK